MSAQQIETMVAAITAALGSTEWQGADRVQFEGGFTGTYTPQSHNVSLLLEFEATMLSHQASSQFTTSIF